VEERIKHIVVGCARLAPSEYTNRQSKMAGYIHWTVYMAANMLKKGEISFACQQSSSDSCNL